MSHCTITGTVLVRRLPVNSILMEQVRSVIANSTKLLCIQLSTQHSHTPHGTMEPSGSHWLILPVNYSWNSPSSWHLGPQGARLVAVWQLKILVCGLWASEDWLPQSKTVTHCMIQMYNTGKNSYHEASWNDDPMHWLFWGNVCAHSYPMVYGKKLPHLHGRISLSSLTGDDTGDAGVAHVMHLPYCEGTPFVALPSAHGKVQTCLSLWPTAILLHFYRKCRALKSLWWSILYNWAI